jgi:photosystem II stability/assembly factor-like uncharacterized protein
MKKPIRVVSRRSAFLTVLLSFFSFLGSQLFAQSQPFQLRWAGTVRSVFTLNGMEYWTSEDGGRIRHTTDSGQSWSFAAVPEDVKDTLNQVFFLSDGLHGWAVGQSGWVLQSSDGGVHWTHVPAPRIAAIVPQSEGPYEELEAVRFIDASHGWVVGLHGLWFTNDAASTFTSAVLLDPNGVPLTPSAIDDMEFYGLDVVLSAGQPPPSILGLAVAEPGWVVKSADPGGTVWQVVWAIQELCPLTVGPLSHGCETHVCDTPPVDIDFWDVAISRNPSSPLALLGGGIGTQCGIILASTDNGAHWHMEYHECNCPTSGPDCHDCSADPLYNPDPAQPSKTYRHKTFFTIYGVAIFGGDNSAIACGYKGQHLFRNPATGVWHDTSSYANDFIDAMTSVVFPLHGAAADPMGVQATGKGLLVGEGGHIRKTTNGGQILGAQGWTDSVPGSPWRIHDVYFTGPDVGWEVGQHFRLAQTATGGKTWSESLPKPDFRGAGNLLAITFAPDGQRGVTVGESDPRSTVGYPNKPKILYTSLDGIGGWLEPNSISVLPDTHWTSVALRAVAWSGAADFWTAGQNGLILHSLGTDGRTWQQFRPAGETYLSFEDFQFYGVAFRDALTGLFVGSLQPANRGFVYQYHFDGVNETWTDLTPTIPNATITSLNGIDVAGDAAYAVGEMKVNGERRGLILSSSFHGTTFAPFAPVPNHPAVHACAAGGDLGRIAVLNKVRIIPSTLDVWAGGECGRIWRYTSATGWIEQKSMTDAHVQGISFPTPTRGYFASHRLTFTQQSLVATQ